MTTPATSDCADWAVTLHGVMDGEVDAVHALAFEAHLAGCEACRADLERFSALRRTVRQDGVRFRAPDRLRAEVLRVIADESRTRRGTVVAPWATRLLGILGRWSFVPSAAALAASLFLVIAAPRHERSLQDDIVASHVRSLLVDHLSDVETSDQHVVKPWFNGKVGFAPKVVDLAARGFPLVGGRLDYLSGHVVAAVIYRRRGHVINVFMWPAQEMGPPGDSRKGYAMLSWIQDGLVFCAVSDVSEQELTELRDALS